jgi:hypothetical protein
VPTNHVLAYPSCLFPPQKMALCPVAKHFYDATACSPVCIVCVCVCVFLFVGLSACLFADRQTDRWTDRQTDRRQTDGQAERGTAIHADTHKNIGEKKTDRLTDNQADRQAGTHIQDRTDRHTQLCKTALFLVVPWANVNVDWLS